MESVIELHDSQVVAILELGTQIVVLLRAYVHTSDGRAGFDAGSGWIQAAALTFANATVDGDIPDLPIDIQGGDLVISGKVEKSTISIPLSHHGKVALTLRLANAEPITLTGKGVELILIGEAVYVEEFSGRQP